VGVGGVGVLDRVGAARVVAPRPVAVEVATGVRQIEDWQRVLGGPGRGDTGGGGVREVYH